MDCGPQAIYPPPVIHDFPIERLLVAGRGEATLRVARAAHRLGLAVYDDNGQPMDDDASLWVTEREQPTVDLLIANARQCGAQGIHRGGLALADWVAVAAAAESADLFALGWSAPPDPLHKDNGTSPKDEEARAARTGGRRRRRPRGARRSAHRDADDSTQAASDEPAATEDGRSVPKPDRDDPEAADGKQGFETIESATPQPTVADEAAVLGDAPALRESAASATPDANDPRPEDSRIDGAADAPSDEMPAAAPADRDGSLPAADADTDTDTDTDGDGEGDRERQAGGSKPHRRISRCQRAVHVVMDKAEMRRLASDAGARIVPGSESALEDAAAASAVAESVGFPVVLKPVRGHGAVGLVWVAEPEELPGRFAEAQRVAAEAFGDDRLYLEKALWRPRRLDVTVLIDRKGRSTCIAERETSLQRSFRSLMVETPSPLFLTHPGGDAGRDALSEGAARIGEALGLQGIVTLEFLVDEAGAIWFIEANLDLHGLFQGIELYTGLDIYELDLRAGLGESAASLTAGARPSGHAFAAAICAEDPAAAFARTSGEITTLRFPPVPHANVRIEAGITEGTKVEATSQSELAHITTYAPIRHRALLAMDRTLAEITIEPLKTNRDLLRRIINHESFRAGHYDTAFVEQLIDA